MCLLGLILPRIVLKVLKRRLKHDCRSLKVGELLLRRTERIAAPWEGGSQAECGALDAVEAPSSAPLALTPEKGCSCR